MMRFVQLLNIVVPVLSFSSNIAPFRSNNVLLFADTERKYVDNDSEMNEDKQRDLLDQLDATYNYDGRLPSKGGIDHRCGYVSIVGAPNMGKSTIMNAVLDEELCVATRRPQTTRHAILGVLTRNDTQLCLFDTPGVIENPAYKLQEGMMEAVMGAFYDADVLLVVTDIFSTPISDDDLFQKVQSSRKPIIVVVNKIDLVDKVKRSNNDVDEEGTVVRTVTTEEAIIRWRQLLPKAIAILPVTATEGSKDVGITALRNILLGVDNDIPASLRNLGRPLAGMYRGDKKTITTEEAKELLPLGPPLYEQDALSDRPERFFCSEIIRAALFQNLKKEVPYCCEVQISNFREPLEHEPNRKILIEAVVLVERDSQKSIIIGKGGLTIKQIGSEARVKLEEFLNHSVYLQLDIKVNKDWRKNEKTLRSFGYMK